MSPVASRTVRTVVLHAMLALGTAWGADSAGAPGESPAAPEIARYPLARDAKDVIGGNPAAEAQRVAFGRWGMELNGIYEFGGGSGGFLAKFPVPALDFESLGFAVDLLPEDFDPGTPLVSRWDRLRYLLSWMGVPFDPPVTSHEQLLSIGPGYRYLCVKPGAGGLEITLNNGDHRIPIPGTAFAARRWHRVIVSLDVQARRLLVALDGTPAVAAPIPPDWTPSVRGLSGAELAKERVFSFTDYSSGASYHGAAAGLRIFGRALSPGEMALIASDRGWEKRTPPPASGDAEENPMVLVSLFPILGLVALLVWWRLRRSWRRAAEEEADRGP